MDEVLAEAQRAVEALLSMGLEDEDDRDVLKAPLDKVNSVLKAMLALIPSGKRADVWHAGERTAIDQFVKSGRGEETILGMSTRIDALNKRIISSAGVLRTIPIDDIVKYDSDYHNEIQGVDLDDVLTAVFGLNPASAIAISKNYISAVEEVLGSEDKFTEVKGASATDAGARFIDMWKAGVIVTSKVTGLYESSFDTKRFRFGMAWGIKGLPKYTVHAHCILLDLEHIPSDFNNVNFEVTVAHVKALADDRATGVSIDIDDAMIKDQLVSKHIGHFRKLAKRHNDVFRKHKRTER